MCMCVIDVGNEKINDEIIMEIIVVDLIVVENKFKKFLIFF